MERCKMYLGSINKRVHFISFNKNKKVLITVHTGFKGSWMCKIMQVAGANVIGYSLEPPTEPSLFSLCHLSEKMNSVIGDIRDLEHLKKVFAGFQLKFYTTFAGATRMYILPIENTNKCHIGSISKHKRTKRNK